tara:strand:- start:2010 stop:2402 length:393 start_codon:yes stop_codon:yes gene_type:complete
MKTQLLGSGILERSPQAQTQCQQLRIFFRPLRSLSTLWERGSSNVTLNGSGLVRSVLNALSLNDSERKHALISYELRNTIPNFKPFKTLSRNVDELDLLCGDRLPFLRWFPLSPSVPLQRSEYPRHDERR